MRSVCTIFTFILASTFLRSVPSKTLNSSSVNVSKFGGIGGGIINGGSMGNGGMNGGVGGNIAPGGGTRFANGFGPTVRQEMSSKGTGLCPQ